MSFHSLALLFLAVGGMSAAADRDPLLDEDPAVVKFFEDRKHLFYPRDSTLDGQNRLHLSITSQEPLTAAELGMVQRTKNLRSMRLSFLAASDATLEALKPLTKLEDLEFCNSEALTVKGMATLAAMPNLRALKLDGMEMDAARLAVLKKSKSLQALSMDGTKLDDKGARELAAFPQLKYLDVDQVTTNGFTGAGLDAILAGRTLVWLEVPPWLLTDGRIAALRKKGWLYGPTPDGFKKKRPATAADVEEIRLLHAPATDRGLEVLLDCKNITKLLLEDTAVSDALLSKMKGFDKLESVTLSSTKVTGRGLVALAASPIAYITLDNCKLEEAALKALGTMPKLRYLEAEDTGIKAEWWKHLAGLKELRRINAAKCGLDAAAARELAKITSLEELGFEGSTLDDAALAELVKLPILTRLNVRQTRVTKPAVDKAQAMYPKLKISSSHP